MRKLFRLCFAGILRGKAYSALSGAAAACALAALISAGCKAPCPPETSRESFLAMGTIASVSLPPGADDRLEQATSLVSDTLSGLERKLSVYAPDSEISLINMNAGRSAVPASPETLDLLKLAMHYSELSGGAFDVTVGPLMEAWGLKGKEKPLRHPPDPEEIRMLQQSVGWSNIVIEGTTAKLIKEGAALDLGGIAKGYAIDISCHRLLGAGIENALVDLGGNMRCLGYKEGNEPWLIGIRNPFRPNQVLGRVRLAGGEAIATSGNYERFVMICGKRYAHIMDPRAGRPAQGMAGVTVISHSAAEADALSTTLFVQGVEEGVLTLAKTSSQAALFIPDKHPVEIWVTAPFADRFQPEPAVLDSVFLIGGGKIQD